MRLERAFLLEQLAKRTSTNVEDSDGSPSPPPTVSSPTNTASAVFSSTKQRTRRPHTPEFSPQPKEKPLRIKRGHRKPSMLANLESGTPSAAGGATFISQNNLRTQSPSSDTFSTQHNPDGKLNGVHGAAPKKPGNAFELYCDETREALKEKNKDKDQDQDGDINMDEELARGWKDLDESQRQEFRAREEHEMTKYQEEKEAYDKKQKESEETAAAAAAATSARRGESQSDDASGDKTITDVDKNGGVGDITREATEERDTTERRRMEDDRTPQPQEDVEMGNYDTDQETQGEKPEE